MAVVDRSGSPLSEAELQALLPADGECSKLLLARCSLASLPMKIPAGWRPLVHLDLGSNQLASVPASLGDLHALEVLNLAGNRLTTLPPELGRLRRLRVLGLRSNRLASLPEELFAGLEALESLFLTDNELTSLSDSLGACLSLRKLQCASNRLSSLSPSLLRLPRLEMLRVPCNQLPRDGVCVAALSAAPSLCWMSLACNPGWPEPPARREVPLVTPADYAPDASDATLGPSGASGVVKACSWRGGAYALKRFTGGVSPDGRPQDELACTLALPRAPGLVDCVAVQRAPELATLMAIAPGAPLGGRPGPTPLLRSTYAPGARYGARVALRTLCDVALALRACHGAGVSHGDVYAHNLVVDPASGAATLVDFGAAFAYGPAGEGPWEALEVRAFGILVAELAGRLEAADELADALLRLAERCSGGAPPERPRFADIVEHLRKLGCESRDASH